MPYIPKKKREFYAPTLTALIAALRENEFKSGHVVYVMYCIALEHWKFNKVFDTVNTIRGVLTSTLDEFNRRIGHPYENDKIRENGDIE